MVKGNKSNNSGTEKAITVAVAGNPNAGKSTLINGLAGSRLHVGNWPGVTVEKRDAFFEFDEHKIRLVDLPGTYSLSPYSQEEIIARNFLVEEKPDVIICVVDATNLERNLYLTMQLLELGIPLVIALNIYDELEKKGAKINIPAMEDILGVKVVPTIATQKSGLDYLLGAVLEVAKNIAAHRPRSQVYSNDIEQAVISVENNLKEVAPEMTKKFPMRWLAYRIMEGDSEILEKTKLTDSPLLTGEAIAHLKNAHGEDIEAVMADARYGQAAGLTLEVLKKPKYNRLEMTDRIDRIVLNRFMGIPIFLGAMWMMFKLTFDISSPFVDFVDGLISGPVTRWVTSAFTLIGSPDWFLSLITEGVIGGVGFVLVFVPVIFAMMFFITLLEGSGYMARAAFVMDRAMHMIGLHGKSFIPLLLGFGCNVPAVYATRTLESNRDRVLTALLVPLVSCGARLPVYVLFTAVFFTESAGTVIWSLYLLGIIMAILVGLAFKNTLFKGEAPLFIMELPPYRLPTLRSLIIHTWEKGKHFLVKAGTYILAVSVLVWFLLNLPWGVESKKDSYLGKTGQVIAPIFEPLGFGNWQSASALITGIVAKEVVVGTMGEIFAGQNEGSLSAQNATPSTADTPPEAGTPQPAQELAETDQPSFSEDLAWIGSELLRAFKGVSQNIFSTFGIASLSLEDEENSSLKRKLSGLFTPLSAYSFLVFVLLYMPCMVVLIAMRHEFGSWKWSAVAFLYQGILAWIVAFLIFQVGSLMGLGSG